MPVWNLSPDKNHPHIFLLLTLSLPLIEAHRRLQSFVAGTIAAGLTTTDCTLRAPMLLTGIVIAAEASWWTLGNLAMMHLRFFLARGWLRPACLESGTESGDRTSKTWSDSERIPHPIEWDMKQNMSKRNRRFMGVCTVSSFPPHCDNSSTITLIIICTTLTIALHFNKRWHALFLLEKQQLLVHYQKYEMLLCGWTKLKHFYNCWPLWGTYEISSNCCSTCRAMMFRWAAYAQLLKQYGREWWIS